MMAKRVLACRNLSECLRGPRTNATRACSILWGMNWPFETFVMFIKCKGCAVSSYHRDPTMKFRFNMLLHSPVWSFINLHVCYFCLSHFLLAFLSCLCFHPIFNILSCAGSHERRTTRTCTLLVTGTCTTHAMQA